MRTNPQPLRLARFRRGPDRRGRSAWIVGLATSRSRRSILRPRPGRVSDFGSRDPSNIGGGPGRDAAVLCRRLRRAAALRRQCGAVRRRGRDRHAVDRGLARARPLPRTLLNAATILIATEAAALTYGALGAATAPFTWPWQAAPIAAGPDLVLSREGRFGGSDRAALEQGRRSAVVADGDRPPTVRPIFSAPASPWGSSSSWSTDSGN